MMQVDEIERIVLEMDKDIEVDTAPFRCAVVLLSALYCGANDLALRRFTEYPKYEVQDFYARFRKAKIFQNGDVYDGGWRDEDCQTGDISFWCDVLCGLGLVDRRMTE